MPITREAFEKLEEIEGLAEKFTGDKGLLELFEQNPNSAFLTAEVTTWAQKHAKLNSATTSAAYCLNSLKKAGFLNSKLTKQKFHTVRYWILRK